MITKIVRILIVIFVTRYIVRFLQSYQALRIRQKEREKDPNQRKSETNGSDSKVVDAEFKVVDR